MAEDPRRGQLMITDVDTNYTVKSSKINLKNKPLINGIIIATISIIAVVAVIITAIIIH